MLAHQRCNSEKGDREPTEAELAKCAAVYAKVDELRKRQGRTCPPGAPHKDPIGPERGKAEDTRRSDKFTCGCPHGKCLHMFTPTCREARYCDCKTKGSYHRIGSEGCIHGGAGEEEPRYSAEQIKNSNEQARREAADPYADPDRASGEYPY